VGPTEAFLTVADVAERLKLNPQTVRNWIDRGELPAYHVGRRVRPDGERDDASPPPDRVGRDLVELERDAERALLGRADPDASERRGGDERARDGR